MVILLRLKLIRDTGFSRDTMRHSLFFLALNKYFMGLIRFMVHRSVTSLKRYVFI
jgi:hypothetical protein